MPQNLKPHSPQWFEAFFNVNPIQAELTRNLIKRAGHADICTTCGDRPLGDFAVQMSPFITLRLCQPCLTIYLRTYGTKITQIEDLRREA